MNIAENLHSIRESIPDHVDLVAVSKTKPNALILEAYNCGQRIFGENKIQDLAEKQAALPKDIQWHFIGHLQTNKVKYIAPFVNLIHAVDSLKLLKEINKRAAQHDRVINCLLQIKIAQEESKFGLSVSDAKILLASEEVANLDNIKITGLMGMSTNTPDQNQVNQEFKDLKSLFDTLTTDYNLTILSMGMSGDYALAIKQGSNMIRVGSSIFGART